MTSEKINKRSQPLVEYELADNDDQLLNNAFDLLFEEIFQENGDLTTNDN